jgi:hypothetical protein
MKKTQNPTYEINKVDELFYELYGYYPNKEGQSYELLVGAVLKILYGQKIIHDESIKGNYDSNSYQIDLSFYSYEAGDNIMVEAKDYSKRNRKVTRPDLDKIVGSIIELNFREGYFFSSTGFTKDAIRKAKATVQNPLTKKIKLFYLRNSNPKDEENRLKTIQLEFQLPEICFNKIKVDLQVDVPPDIINSLSAQSQTLFKENRNFVFFEGILKNNENIEVGKYSFSKELDEDIYEQGLNNKDLVYERTLIINDGYFEVNGENYVIEKAKVIIPLKINVFS